MTAKAKGSAAEPPAPDQYGTVRIPLKLLREVDAFVHDNDEGYMNRSQVGTDAFRTFLAWKREQRMRREVWDAWVRDGRKGPPPEPPAPFAQPWSRRDK